MLSLVRKHYIICIKPQSIRSIRKSQPPELITYPDMDRLIQRRLQGVSVDGPFLSELGTEEYVATAIFFSPF